MSDSSLNLGLRTRFIDIQTGLFTTWAPKSLLGVGHFFGLFLRWETKVKVNLSQPLCAPPKSWDSIIEKTLAFGDPTRNARF